jgi:hypothetical protein
MRKNPKRKVYTLTNNQRVYKVNLPIYLSVEMVQGLSRLTGMSEQKTINYLLSTGSQAAELVFGEGAVEEDQREVYVPIGEDHPSHQSGGERASHYGEKFSDMKEGKSWNLTEHYHFAK